MSEFTRYALIGAGRVGKSVISSLLAKKPNVSLLVLTRSPEKASELPLPSGSKNVQIKVVDFTSSSSISSALKAHGTEIFIDTILVNSSSSHNNIADAAKDAGVRLFVAAEFGGITDAYEGENFNFAEKAKTQKYLKEIALPFVVIQNGAFIEFIPWLGATWTGKYHIVGKGDQPISTTSMHDSAGFLVHILTTYPLAQLSNSYHRIQGDRGTFLDFAKRLNLPVEFVDRVPDAPGTPNVDLTKPSPQTNLHKLFETGQGSVGWDNKTGKHDDTQVGSGNKLWEGHVWKKLEDVHGAK